MMADTIDVRFLGGRMSALQKDFAALRREISDQLNAFEKRVEDKMENRLEAVNARLGNIEEALQEVLRRLPNGKI
jgi:hypothetical protein